MTLYPRNKLLRITCVFAGICWLLLFTFLIGLLLYNLGFKLYLFAIYWKPLFIGWLFFSFAYILLALIFHCPHCKKRFLIQTNKEKHRNAQKLKIFNYWSTTIINILFDNKFTCMYCGNSYRVKQKKLKFPNF